MGHQFLKGFYLLCLWQWGANATAASPPLDGVCFRYHEQWKVGDKARGVLREKHGIACVRFSTRGDLIVEGLSPANQARMKRFYQQCMQDGCLFCDASEGYCETGTCGPGNRDCKPYMRDGRPLCGEDCAYYALNQL
jgi:hypothetical protein